MFVIIKCLYQSLKICTCQTYKASLPWINTSLTPKCNLFQAEKTNFSLQAGGGGRWNFREVDPRFSSIQFSSVTQSCPTLCDPMNCSTPGLPVHHQLPEFTQTHIHRVSDAIQPSHPLSSPSPPAPSPSQHQSLFQWVNSSHEVTKALEFQL